MTLDEGLVEDLVEDIADEDTKSILTDDADKDIQSNIYMTMHVVAKFLTNASGATLWLNFQQMLVVPSVY